MREAIEEINKASERARYASSALAAASKLAKKGEYEKALNRLHNTLNVLAAATAAASEACILLADQD